MPREVWMALCGVLVVWGIAVAIKAMAALRRQKPYVLSMWESGALRAGKVLGRAGIVAKVAAGILMAAACTTLLTGALPYRIATYAVMAVAALDLVVDFALTKKD